ncbi:hypothetical protein [Microbacterium sp. SORGH_AS_0421]|uniref:hypothetical protein n=1 Tax=Microbacterium sp. SORGH_AS_0421 TaxID=3041768 RepID=UPI00278D6F32|nr:hypothetical protein [Microbacterium sp. SORGH_AS_0421]MDQ1176211.1 hypothetical protein [Microbacterium sp. SORGH_AS_0421]
MESAGRGPELGEWPDWMNASEIALSEVMDPMRKIVASGALDEVEWNAELVRGDAVEAVLQLKDQPGGGVSPGGVKLPAVHGLIDDYTFVVHAWFQTRVGAARRRRPVFTQGSGKNKTRVVVDNKTGNIMTVTKG